MEVVSDLFPQDLAAKVGELINKEVAKKVVANTEILSF